MKNAGVRVELMKDCEHPKDLQKGLLMTENVSSQPLKYAGVRTTMKLMMKNHEEPRRKRFFFKEEKLTQKDNVEDERECLQPMQETKILALTNQIRGAPAQGSPPSNTKCSTKSLNQEKDTPKDMKSREAAVFSDQHGIGENQVPRILETHSRGCFLNL